MLLSFVHCAQKYAKNCLSRFSELNVALEDKNPMSKLEAIGKYFDKEQFI